MPDWTEVEIHPTHGRVFKRPLSPKELAFVIDSHFGGTTDNLHHAVLCLSEPQDLHLFSEANIVQAWLSTKRRHPLAGATVQLLPQDGGESVSSLEHHFVVRERDLAVLRPQEIVFGQVASAEEALQRIAAIWEGPRPLSDELLLKLFVFREADPLRTDVLHVVMVRAHCMTDGTADRTFMRCLLDTLARGGQRGSEPAQMPLEERLAMVIPETDLAPMHLRLLSPARRRWRSAIAAVIFHNRPKFWTGLGGHTLPCRLTRVTQEILARPGFAYTLLAAAETTTALANCRLHKITFGTAYLVLAQVAMTRVLYRRHLRGDISEEEWEYRKRQPYRTVGPINLRPYLDKSWYEKGGGGEFMECMDVFFYQLPFMTLGEREPHHYRGQELPDGAPPFSHLLTFDRFLHRAGMVRKQAKAFFGHPLFFELMWRRDLLMALRRAKQTNVACGIQKSDQEEVLTVQEMTRVFAHGGSSLGNMDLIFPSEYPLPPTHQLSPFSPISHPVKAGYAAPPPSSTEVDSTPRIVVESSMTRLYTRPGELYLGAVTFRGRLNMHCFYDKNVYEDAVVTEWLDELKNAIVWYLGQTHASS